MRDAPLTARQVAERLGVTVRTVQRWIAEGRLPATRVGGRARIARDALDAVRGQPAAHAARPPRARAPVRAVRAVLVANRGEVVARVARSARRLGVRSIGVVAPDDWGGHGVDLLLPVPSYLDGDAIIDAARRAGADAIHPGYGFLAESADFASAVLAAGLTWVGPPPDAMAAVADKAAARRTAAAAGVPVLPGSEGTIQDDAGLAAEAERIGYPLLVKPRAGGGGKGMRAVDDTSQLPEALAAARREAARAFGDDRLILERRLVGARHVEVQVLFDASGAGRHLGERDCSTQRRSQKIVEESPAPSVVPVLRRQLGEAALAIGRAVGYVGAGTVEFLVAEDGTFAFIEMNARLQVEHPVTEALTGRDLVADQLAIAAGARLSDLSLADEPILHGHAIEARLYAEDPESGFLPASGRLLRLRWPEGVRVDAGVREGDEVSDRYDPMLAKLIVHAPTREQAVRDLAQALEATLILGLRSNLRFLRWLVQRPELREGQMRIDTLDSLLIPPPPVPDEPAWQSAALALLAAGPYGAWGGGWRTNAPAAVRMRAPDEERRVVLDAAPGRPVDVAVEGDTAHVEVEGQSLALRLAMPPSIEEAVRHADVASGRVTLRAPMPGRVVAVRHAIGDAVRERATVIVIEAMKMEHAVASPIAGRLAGLDVAIGQQVERGQPLAEVAESGGVADERP